MIDIVLDWPRALAAALLVIAYAGYCVQRHRADLRACGVARERTTQQKVMEGEAVAPAPVWVIYASQTGQAEAVARQTAAALEAAACPVRLARLHDGWLDDAHAARSLLFVVSTYGDGEPPEHAVRFARTCMDTPAALDGVPYAVLALGDRHYARFCGFGRALDQWLARSGAQPMFPRIDVDRLDPAPLHDWLCALLAGATPSAHAGFTTWRFVGRECLNPGSPGEALCRVRLRPAMGALPDWQAGDLADVLPPADLAHARTYSIASRPGDGVLELIVRSCRNPEGAVGAASGWLNEQAVPGDGIAMRVRARPELRLEAESDMPLILIGAGAGLAGLHVHLAARAATLAATHTAPPSRCTWLFYGERSPRHDRPCEAEIAGWLRDGVLTRADFAFSRDPQMPRYVQHLLAPHAEALRDWIAHGAHVLVCGAAKTMAPGVDAALRNVLGSGAMNALQESGRMLRDVF